MRRLLRLLVFVALGVTAPGGSYAQEASHAESYLRLH